MPLGTIIFTGVNALLWWAAARWHWPLVVVILVASLNGVGTTAYDLGWRPRWQ
jgi:hypothetical protein